MSDFDAGFAKPAGNTWKPGKVGDAIKGVLKGSKPFDGQYGQTIVCSVQAIAGKFHNIDEKGNVSDEETEVKNGEFYDIFVRDTFDEQIKKAAVGQQIIVRYAEHVDKPKRGGKPYKNVECLLGPVADPFEKKETADSFS